MALGEQVTRLPDYPRAFEALRKSRLMMRQLVADLPDDPSYRLALAECDKELGIAESEGSEPDHALERLREAESILRDLPARVATDPANRKRLADTINVRGVLHWKFGQYDDALKTFQECQGIYQSLLDGPREGPPPAELLSAMGLSYYNIGTMLFIQNPRDRHQAMAMFEKALEYRNALVIANPSVNDFRESLAINLTEVAPLRHELGKTPQALAAIQSAIEILEGLVKSRPDMARYHSELGRALHILGYLYDEDRDNVRGLVALRKARDEEDLAVADAPESDSYKMLLADILWNLGEQYLDLGQVADGLPHYRRAVSLRRKLLAERPADRGRKLALADQLAMLAAVERHGGEPGVSRRWYDEAAGILAQLNEAADDVGVQVLRAGYLLGEARCAVAERLDSTASSLLEQAAAILAPLTASSQPDTAALRRFSEVLWEQARLARRAGDPAAAGRLEGRQRDLWNDRPPGELVHLALEEITSAARVGYGRTRVTPLAESVRRHDLDLAADHLRLAVALGFRDLSALRGSRDLGLVLARPDLPAVLYDAAYPADPIPPRADAP